MKTVTSLALLVSLATLVATAVAAKEEASPNYFFPRIRQVPNVLASRAALLTPAKIKKNNADIAHGVLMGIAVVLLFPIGAMITRMTHSRNLIKIHVFCQVFGLIVLMAGFGSGIYTAVLHTEVYTDPHTAYGTAIVAFFLIQPLFGLLHHLGWVHKQRQTLWTHIHVWWGRAILVLAVVNGGYGILYANNAVPGQKGYGALAGIVGVAYIALAAFWYSREQRIREEKIREEVKAELAGAGAGQRGVVEVNDGGDGRPVVVKSVGVDEKMV